MSDTHYESKYGRWYEFGKYTETGNVDVNTSIEHVEVLTNIKQHEADKIIRIHNDMVAELDQLLEAA